MSIVIQYGDIKRRIESIYVGYLTEAGLASTYENKQIKQALMIFQRGEGIYVG